MVSEMDSVDCLGEGRKRVSNIPVHVTATLQPDGMTLRLEEKLALPPGRVNVTIQAG